MPEQSPFNPERDNFYHVVATIMKHGYVLSHVELDYIMPYYGYENLGTKIMDAVIGRRIIEAEGVGLVREKYRGRAFFYDGNLSLEETDFEKVKKELDEEADAALQARRNTRAARAV